MKRISIALFTLALAACDSGQIDYEYAATTAERDSAVRAVVAQLEGAWRDGDGDAWGSAFAEEADFTVWFGLYMKGRDQIAGGHQYIFNDFYKDTVLDIEVRSLRFLADDVALVQAAGWVYGETETRPDGDPMVAPLIVLSDHSGEWKVEAFQNTPYLVNRYREHGDIRELSAPAE